MLGNERVTKNNWDGGVQVDQLPDAGKYLNYIKANKPFPMAPVTIISPQQAYEMVLANSGATLPRRDAVDLRIVKEVSTGKTTYKDGIITDIKQVGGYPEYKGTPYKDSDNDGMPDDWEKKYGLNPKNASDAVGDMNGDGYTNIEKFIFNIDPLKKVDWTDPKNNRDTRSAKL